MFATVQDTVNTVCSLVLLACMLYLGWLTGKSVLREYQPQRTLGLSYRFVRSLTNGNFKRLPDGLLERLFVIHQQDEEFLRVLFDLVREPNADWPPSRPHRRFKVIQTRDKGDDANA